MYYSNILVSSEWIGVSKVSFGSLHKLSADQAVKPLPIAKSIQHHVGTIP